MARTTHTTPDPVVLEGYQAIMKPSQYGYSLKAIAPESVIAKLEEERPETLKWAESKLKNPKRSLLKPEPWEEVSQGNYLLKFSWDPNKDPVVVVDSEGTHITDENTPLFGGSQGQACLLSEALCSEGWRHLWHPSGPARRPSYLCW